MKNQHEHLFLHRFTVVIIDEPDLTGRPLDGIGIGDATAIIDEQTLAPSDAIILREIRREMRAHLARMTHHQQPATGQPADKETRLRMRDDRWSDVCPGLAAIFGKRFAQPVAGAHQHPERAVLALDNHVFVAVAVLVFRDRRTAELRKGHALIRGTEDA